MSSTPDDLMRQAAADMRARHREAGAVLRHVTLPQAVRTDLARRFQRADHGDVRRLADVLEVLSATNPSVRVSVTNELRERCIKELGR